jgi:hypothetical protein
MRAYKRRCYYISNGHEQMVVSFQWPTAAHEDGTSSVVPAIG